MSALLERRFALFAAALILLLGTIQVVTVLGETQTWDEGIHLLAGYAYWTRGDYRVNPEHPALGKMLNALPLLAMRPDLKYQDASGAWESVVAAVEFIYRNRYSPEALLFAGRAVTIVFTLLFAALVAWWTRRRFGAFAALLALTLFVFDPNITAHGRYITTDLFAAAFTFSTAVLWIEYLLAPSKKLLVLSGLSLGCALTSKYSALFLLPAMLIAWIARAVWVRRGTGQAGLFTAKRFVAAAAVLALLSVATIAVVYAPEVLRTRELPKAHGLLFGKGPVGPMLKFMSPKLGLRAWSWVIGLDRLSEHDEGGHQSYLMGQFSEHGWWYYFPVAFLVKNPVGTIALLALAAVAAAFGWRRLRPYAFPLVMVAFFGGLFAFFCIRSHINIGHRHLLPFYAFAYVAAAAVLAHASGALLRRARGFVLGILLLLAAGESLAIYPHYLAFFNFAAGGPANGPKYLLDSNIDWGQDVMKAAKWKRENKVDHVCLSFFGNVDLWRYMTGLDNLPDTAEKQKDVDCVVMISVTPLYGLYVPREQYRYWREKEPWARIGYSIYAYDHRKKRP